MIRTRIANITKRPLAAVAVTGLLSTLIVTAGATAASYAGAAGPSRDQPHSATAPRAASGAHGDDEHVAIPGRTGREPVRGKIVGVEVSGVATAPASHAPGDRGKNRITRAFYLEGKPGALHERSLAGTGARVTASWRGLSEADVGRAPRSGRPSAARSIGGYACVRSTTIGSRLKAFPPQHLDISNGDWEIHYIDHLYSVERARVIGRKQTTQFEQCAVGGARNKHSWTQRLAHTESDVSVANRSDVRIGQSWGTHVDNGTVSANLGFELKSGVATILGSLPVSNGGHEAGSIGDGLCGNLPGNSGNQVNGAWNFTYPGIGTSEFKGNVAQALYEYRRPHRRFFPWHFHICATPRY